MSTYRIEALIYLIVGLALMIFGVILHIKKDAGAIWAYVVGMFFVNKADNLLVWDRITKEEK